MEKVWFITGASKGFGLAIARAALKAGDKVAATVRSNPNELKATFGRNPNLYVLRMDVTRENDVMAAVTRSVKRFGKLDVIVNNAGYGILGAIEEISDAEVKAQYDTNVFGVLNVLRAVLPFLRKQNSGHVINFSSHFAFESIPGWALYGSTKFAVEGISQGLFKELQPFGIHVTAVEPGMFRTNFCSKGSYQIPKKIIEAYSGTMVGHMRDGVAEFHGFQPGDPAKLATVIVNLGHTERPPLHLPIGKDAVSMYRIGAANIARDIDEWLDVSLSTDNDK